MVHRVEGLPEVNSCRTLVSLNRERNNARDCKLTYGWMSITETLASFCSYSSRLLFGSKCLMMAASILLVRVTRGAFDDEMEGGLHRMATMPLLPEVV